MRWRRRAFSSGYVEGWKRKDEAVLGETLDSRGCRASEGGEEREQTSRLDGRAEEGKFEGAIL